MSEPDTIVVKGAREHNLKSVDARDPQEAAGGLHRRLRLGQELAGLRHPLRRGAAPLRRVALRLRPAVPRADGEAAATTPSAASRRPSPSSRRRPPTTRAPPWAPSPRSTTTCACSTPASACSTAPAAAARWASSPPQQIVDDDPGAARRVAHPAARPARAEPQGRVPRAARRRAAARLRPRPGRRRWSTRSTSGSPSTRSASTTSSWWSTGWCVKGGASARASPTRWRPRCARARGRWSSPMRHEQKVGPGIDPEGQKHDRFFSERTPARPAASPSASWRRRASPSTARSACAPSATGSAPSPRWIRSWSSPTRRSPSARARSSPGPAVMERGEGWTFEFVEHLAKVARHRPRHALGRARQAAPRPRAPRLGRSRQSSWPGAKGSASQCEGVLNQLYRRFQATELRGHAPATTCASSPTSPARPARASGCEPESRAVKVRGGASSSSSRMTIGEARDLARRRSPLSGDRGAASPRSCSRRSSSRLGFLLDVGLGYLTLDRPRPVALRRREPAHPARLARSAASSPASSTSSTSPRSACTSATTASSSPRSSGCATSATP